MAHVAGLVAAGVYPNPVQIADVTTTTTHKTLRGPRSGLILAKANEEIEKKLQSAVFPGNQGGPLMHAIAAKAICFKEAMAPEYKTYQQQVVKNAQAMAAITQKYLGIDGLSDADNPLVYQVSQTVNMLPLLTYQKIYYDAFSNSQWEKHKAYAHNVDYWSGTGNISLVTDMVQLRYANYPKDYFMGMLPSSQYGSVAVLPSSPVGSPSIVTGKQIGRAHV